MTLHFLFFLSGAAALGYQLLWTKLFATGLGHEYPAVLAIVCAFMAGMALGAVTLDRFIPRSARAGRWLAGLEMIVGIWAIVATLGTAHANELALQWIGLAPSAWRHWFVAFAVPAAVLLPATMAMGATFPAMEKFLSAVTPHQGSVGSVYAANTFGAVAGTLLTPYLLMPALGLTHSCWLLAALNVVVGIGILAVSRSSRRDESKAGNRAETNALKFTSLSHRRVSATLFFTGLFGIGYEMVGVRVLAQVLEGTVYTYAAVLAVFLGSTATGAAAYHRWGRFWDPRHTLSRLTQCTAIACGLGIAALGQASPLYRFARGFGDSPVELMLAELITAAAVFAPPAFFMGALFSHLLQMTRSAGEQIGPVVALNTLGAALAPILSVLLLPHFGTNRTLVSIGAAYATLALDLSRAWLPLASVAALVLALTTNLRLVDVPPGGRVLDYHEGVMASVAVVEQADRHRILRVDNRYQMGGTASADAEYRQAHIPLLLHPQPASALFLGLGTGISFGAATLHPKLRADGVELVPEVVDVMSRFFPANFSPAQQPQLSVHVADARRFARTSRTHYDVIVADLFHPYRDGAGALYTREHFSVIRERLNTNGLFCQWLPLHQLDEPTLRVIVHTFLEIFPEGEAWLLRLNVDVPVVGLIGRNSAQMYAAAWIESRVAETPLSDVLKRLSLGDSVRFFGNLVADARDLRGFSHMAPVNTDENQRVTFMAPKLSYRQNAKAHASLFALLRASTPDVKQVLHLPDAEISFASRISAYMAARDVYLRGLVLYSEDHEDAINAYLESARLSKDFTAGYAHCLSIASVLANSEPARAKEILEKLIEAQPERPVAREMLQRLTTP